MRNATGVIIAAAVLAAAGSAQAEERLIVQDSDLLVVADRSVPCGETVPLTVRSTERGVFARDSARMQQTIDGVRAILGFECARIPGFEISGELGQDSRPVFEGRAGDRTGWLVETSSTEISASEASAASSGSSSGSSSGAAGVSGDTPRIAGLQLGMTANEAVQNARAEFEGSVSYQGAEQILIAEEGGCEFRDSTVPRAGSRCLEAAFTGESTPRLGALGYSQAVDLDRRSEIERRLTEQFGEPVQRVSSSGVAANGNNPYLFLSWDGIVAQGRGGRLGFIDAPLRELEAYAVARDGVTVVTIWNQAAGGLSVDDPQHQLKF